MHAALAAVAVTLLLPAHASVIGSTPENGSSVTEQPGSFSVVLNEQIIDVPGAQGANALELRDATGLYYGDGCATVDGDAISLDAELGAAGDYTLTYQVVSADGHPVSGEIAFAFEPLDGTGGPDGSAAAPVCAAPAAADPAVQEPAASDPTGAEPTSTEQPSTDPASTEPSTSEAPASTDAPEVTASAEQGAPIESEAPAEEAGGQLPFLAIGVLAVLAVLAVIAYRANRLRKDRAADDA